MPRPPLGDEARTEIIYVRVTKSQKRALEMVFGKAAEGLHAIFMIWLKGPRT